MTEYFYAVSAEEKKSAESAGAFALLRGLIIYMLPHEAYFLAP